MTQQKCNCNQCITDIKAVKERITTLEQKKRKLGCGGNKTPTPRIPAWFKMWSETIFEKRMSHIETEIVNTNKRIDNLESQVNKRIDNLVGSLKPSAFKTKK